MAYKDLREWLRLVEKEGHLVRVEGVDRNLEVAAFCNLTSKIVLFDKLPGFPAGYRMVGNRAGEVCLSFLLLLTAPPKPENPSKSTVAGLPE